MLIFHPYTSDYRKNCLDVFRSNVPKFFHEAEINEYTNYLDNYVSNNYWCCFNEDSFLGAGGIWVRPDGIGRLVWGMIRFDKHRKGFGRQLIQFRLKKLASISLVEIIQLDTSQHNTEFYKRFGFRELSVKQDFYGPGLHSYEMELNLTPEKRQELITLI